MGYVTQIGKKEGKKKEFLTHLASGGSTCTRKARMIRKATLFEFLISQLYCSFFHGMKNSTGTVAVHLIIGCARYEISPRG